MGTERNDNGGARARLLESAKRAVRSLSGAALQRRVSVPPPHPSASRGNPPRPNGRWWAQSHAVAAEATARADRPTPSPSTPFPSAAFAASKCTPAPPIRTKNNTKPNVITHTQKHSARSVPPTWPPPLPPSQLPLLAPTPVACARGTNPRHHTP